MSWLSLCEAFEIIGFLIMNLFKKCDHVHKQKRKIKSVWT